jgi:hypothetical protein
VWLPRTNKGDAEGPCRHGKNCRAAVDDCGGPGPPVRSGNVQGGSLDGNPLFQGTETGKCNS